MNSFTYENSGFATYLVYKANPEDEIDSMTLGMITNNKILGLAPAFFAQMDNTKFIKYNVSAKVSVKQFFEGHVNKKRLIGVFLGIVNAILSAEDYMIDLSSIVFDLNYIFSDVSTCETMVICLPIIKKDVDINLLSFFKNIMFTTQFDQTENCDYVARIINYLNNSSSFSIIEFKNLLECISGDGFEQNYSKPSKNNSYVQPSKISSPAQGSGCQQPPVVPSIPAQHSSSMTQQRSSQYQNQPKNKQSQFLVPNSTAEQRSGTTVISHSSQDVVDTGNEDRISFMYLMQHYNKENAAKYKAQKAAKKASKKGVQTQKPQKGKKQTTKSTFVVPGAPANNSFAIPGQQTVVNTPQVQTTVQPTDNTPEQHHAVQQRQFSQTVQPVSVATHNPIGNHVSKPASFGETTVLGGGSRIGETTVLGASSPEVQIHPHLIRTKNNERINLDKPVFRIGKERSYVDYFVSDNTAVSRSHANIISRDGQYYIVDTNSTNHTYVNGGMIQSNVETPLSHGAKIRLANEDFEFRLY